MNDSDALRFAVVQPGPRLHYAVPTLLERAGMLRCFYTDICASVGPLRILDQLWPGDLRPPAIERMFGRKLPSDLPRAKVHQIAITCLGNALARKLGVFDTTSSTAKLLLKRALAENLGGANAIYTVIVNEDLEFCRQAKARGCRIVHEVMLNPDIGLHLDEEHRRFPEVPCGLPSLAKIESGRDRDRRKYAIADLILVPSLSVFHSVVALGADPSKVAIVPYGIDESWLHPTPRPVPGRVLFVGSVGLLKGNHYLAAAARQLASRNPKIEIRVVGPISSDLAHMPLFAGPHYVGQVPRSSVQKEFLAADVFVLPTLCEGFGLAHLEALASGVPVITTPNCGSVVRDAVDGFIVPTRDPARLADSIEHIVSHRNLRAKMSKNARARASQFTWARYGARLINAISRLQSPPYTSPLVQPELSGVTPTSVKIA